MKLKYSFPKLPKQVLTPLILISVLLGSGSYLALKNVANNRQAAMNQASIEKSLASDVQNADELNRTSQPSRTEPETFNNATTSNGTERPGTVIADSPKKGYKVFRAGSIIPSSSTVTISNTTYNMPVSFSTSDGKAVSMFSMSVNTAGIMLNTPAQNDLQPHVRHSYLLSAAGVAAGTYTATLKAIYEDPATANRYEYYGTMTVTVIDPSVITYPTGPPSYTCLDGTVQQTPCTP